MKANYVPVGLGLVLINKGHVLLARRKVRNGHYEYGSPGGAMERGESFRDAILRELKEECGQSVRVSNLRPLCTINYRRTLDNHAVGIGYTADFSGGDIINAEPTKHDDWIWHDLKNLPTPLFPPVDQYIQSYQSGQTFFE